jgi:hypothetical protein
MTLSLRPVAAAPKPVRVLWAEPCLELKRAAPVNPLLLGLGRAITVRRRRRRLLQIILGRKA